MGRQVRRVPGNWQHPKGDDGEYIPLRDLISKDLAFWEAEKAMWDDGFVRDWDNGPRLADMCFKPRDKIAHGVSFDDWHGKRPEETEYMPDWPEHERTHFQFYESTTEGTPESPVFATKQELAEWLRENVWQSDTVEEQIRSIDAALGRPNGDF